VEGDVDPSRDLDIIHEELRLKDIEYLNKHMDNIERAVLRGGDKSKKHEYVNMIFRLSDFKRKVELL
jgi:obg-like ATPase 1